MENNWICEGNNSLIIAVYVVPRSSKSEIVGIYNNCLKIKLKAPPVDNAANEELVRFLADKLKVLKANIKIVKGHKQKRKTVVLYNVKAEAVRKLTQ